MGKIDWHNEAHVELVKRKYAELVAPEIQKQKGLREKQVEEVTLELAKNLRKFVESVINVGLVRRLEAPDGGPLWEEAKRLAEREL